MSHEAKPPKRRRVEQEQSNEHHQGHDRDWNDHNHSKHDHARPIARRVDTSKPTAIYNPRGPRDWTLSVAVPGSIIANAQNHDLKTSLAGQLARALAVFSVDEVVVFDDDDHAKRVPDDEPSYTGDVDPSHFLMHILLYLETPPHLRRHLFGIHPNLRTAGTLPSLDMPHHVRADEWCVYREGVTVGYEDERDANGMIHGEDGVGSDEDRRRKKKKTSKKKKTGKEDEEIARKTIVDAGLRRRVIVDDDIQPNTRVTVKLPDRTTGASMNKPKTTESEYLPAEVVSPDTPREERGYYWGYTVRRASSISAVFTECRFDGGYDLSFGTSERGTALEELIYMGQYLDSTDHREDDANGDAASAEDPDDDASPGQPSTKGNNKGFKHMLLAFGGLGGLESAIGNDPVLKNMHHSADSTQKRSAKSTPAQANGSSRTGDISLFDHWINICPDQGSRTIRTVEAVWIALARLKEFVGRNG